MVIESQEAGTITPDFYEAIVRVVTGVNQRYGVEAYDDTIQDVCVAVLTNLDKFDPAKNLFSYLTTLVRNASNKRYRQRVRDEMLIWKVRNTAWE